MLMLIDYRCRLLFIISSFRHAADFQVAALRHFIFF